MTDDGTGNRRERNLIKNVRIHGFTNGSGLAGDMCNWDVEGLKITETKTPINLNSATNSTFKDIEIDQMKEHRSDRRNRKFSRGFSFSKGDHLKKD
jgi:hypothetical protein